MMFVEVSVVSLSEVKTSTATSELEQLSFSWALPASSNTMDTQHACKSCSKATTCTHYIYYIVLNGRNSDKIPTLVLL